MDNELEKQIESVLFWKAEPLTVSELTKILSAKSSEVAAAIENLKVNLANRGISLITNNDEVYLVTSPESAKLIERLQKEELTKDLSRAALETLSIILYRGPLKRSDIDYIRGVNSQFILRVLLVRGLIDKKIDPKDERAYIYSPTIDTLAHLGVQSVRDLPEYSQVNTDIESFLKLAQALDQNQEK